MRFFPFSSSSSSSSSSSFYSFLPLLLLLLLYSTFVSSLPYGIDHYMDAHPRPGIDYYGYSISGPLQAGTTHGYYRPGESTGSFKTLFTDNKNWAARPFYLDDTFVATKPSFVTAIPPVASDTLNGTCILPRGNKDWPSNNYPQGVHVWLANLLYSEQMAWPFSVWITAVNANSTNENDYARSYNFSIPLFSHTEFPTSYLYGGSTRTNIHSWSSYGSGLWTVFCNSWYIDPYNGELRVSNYTALDSMDSIEGGFANWVEKTTSRTNYPVTSPFPIGTGWEATIDTLGTDGMGNKSYYLNGPYSKFPYGPVRLATCDNVCLNNYLPNGLWGKYIAIPPQKNKDTMCCLRENPRSYYRNVEGVAGSYLDFGNDCCWFGLARTIGWRVTSSNPDSGTLANELTTEFIVTLPTNGSRTGNVTVIASYPAGNYGASIPKQPPGHANSATTEAAYFAYMESTRVAYEFLWVDMNQWSGKIFATRGGTSISTFPPIYNTSFTFTNVPIGIRQTFMVRSVPVLDKGYNSNGNLFRWVSPWSYAHITIPRTKNEAPRPIENAITKVPGLGIGDDTSNPATDGLVGVPYRWNFSEIRTPVLSDTYSNYNDLRVTVYYDNSAFSKIGMNPMYSRPVTRTWPPSEYLGIGSLASRQAYVNDTQGSTEILKSLPLSFLNETFFTLIPTEANKLYTIMLRITDTGVPVSYRPSVFGQMVNYDPAIVEGNATTVLTYSFIAKPCGLCPYGSTPSAPCTERGKDTVCKPCTVCTPGQRRISLCSGLTLQDTICADCNKNCPAGMRKKKECDGISPDELICEPCEACPYGQYPLRGCDGTDNSNYTCAVCPTPGQNETTLYFPPGCPIAINGVALANVIKASGGETIFLAGNASGSSSGTNRFLYCSVCPLNEYEDPAHPCGANNGMTDRQCKPCSTCTTNQYETRSCTPYQDRTCGTCRTSCPVNFYISSPCTASSDALCTTCRNVCPVNEYIVTPCTATEDLRCTACACSNPGTLACNPLNGQCTCKPGWTGTTCNACTHGRYGGACDLTCACDTIGTITSSTNCNSIDGQCHCRPFFTGYFCDVCVPGRYGPNCEYECGTCSNHGTCAFAYGGGRNYSTNGGSSSNICICDIGYAGEQCEETLTNAGGKGIYTNNHHVPILTPLIAYENQPWIYNLPVDTFTIVLEDGKSSGIATHTPVNVSLLYNRMSSSLSWLTLEYPVITSPSGYRIVGTPHRENILPYEVTNIVLEGKLTNSSSPIGNTLAISIIPVIVRYTNQAPVWNILTPPSVTTVRIGDLYELVIRERTNITENDRIYGDTIDVYLLNNTDIVTDQVSSLSWLTVRIDYESTGTGTTNTYYYRTWTFRGYPPVAASNTTSTMTLMVIDSNDAYDEVIFTLTVPSIDTVPAALVFDPSRLFSTDEGIGTHTSGGTLTIKQENYFSYTLPFDAFTIAEGSIPIVQYDVTILPLNTSMVRRQLRPIGSVTGTPRLLPTVNTIPNDNNNYINNPDCAWIRIGHTVDTVPRPLLYGEPQREHSGTSCLIRIMATNAAGFTVTGSFPSRITYKNTPPQVIGTVSTVTKAYGEAFRIPFVMSTLFYDIDADSSLPENKYRSIDTVRYRLLVSDSTFPLPVWLRFECDNNFVYTTCYLYSDIKNTTVIDTTTVPPAYLLSLQAYDNENATTNLIFSLQFRERRTYRIIESAWSMCTKLCGNEHRYKTFTCIDNQGTIVDNHNCGNTFVGMVSESCSLHSNQSCTTPYWTVGPWSKCDAPCIAAVSNGNTASNGTNTVTVTEWIIPMTIRTVVCYDPILNQIITDNDCTFGNGNKPDTFRVCNTQICLANLTLVTPGNGNNDGTGSEGSHSGSSTNPLAFLNLTTTLSNNDSGSSVSTEPTVSSLACNGVLDPIGTCCVTPSPSGFCCVGNYRVLDDCGICGGTNSCPLSDTLTLTSSAMVAELCVFNPNTIPVTWSTVSNLTVLTNTNSTLQNALSLALNVPNNQITVTGLVCYTPLYTNSPQITITYIINEYNRPTTLVTAAVVERLTGYISNDAAVVSNQPTRYGTCGNLMCERGETGISCPSDCGFTMLTCPIHSLTNKVCNGHGACQLSTGNCKCHPGWTGSGCDSCDIGYTARALAIPTTDGRSISSVTCLSLLDTSVLLDIVNSSNKDNLSLIWRLGNGTTTDTNGGNNFVSMNDVTSSSSASSFISTPGFTGLMVAVASILVATVSIMLTVTILRNRYHHGSTPPRLARLFQNENKTITEPTTDDEQDTKPSPHRLHRRPSQTTTTLSNKNTMMIRTVPSIVQPSDVQLDEEEEDTNHDNDNPSSDEPTVSSVTMMPSLTSLTMQKFITVPSNSTEEKLDRSSIPSYSGIVRNQRNDDGNSNGGGIIHGLNGEKQRKERIHSPKSRTLDKSTIVGNTPKNSSTSVHLQRESRTTISRAERGGIGYSRVSEEESDTKQSNGTTVSSQ